MQKLTAPTALQAKTKEELIQMVASYESKIQSLQNTMKYINKLTVTE